TVRGEQLHARLAEIAARRPIVAELRGLGLLRGIELRAPGGGRFAAADGMSGKVSAEAKRRGLMIYSCPTPVGTEHMDALLLAPPLAATEAEVGEIAAGRRES